MPRGAHLDRPELFEASQHPRSSLEFPIRPLSAVASRLNVLYSLRISTRGILNGADLVRSTLSFVLSLRHEFLPTVSKQRQRQNDAPRSLCCRESPKKEPPDKDAADEPTVVLTPWPETQASLLADPPSRLSSLPPPAPSANLFVPLEVARKCVLPTLNEERIGPCCNTRKHTKAPPPPIRSHPSCPGHPCP